MILRSIIVITWLTFLFGITMFAYTKPVGMWELCHSVVSGKIDNCARTGGLQ